MNCDSRTFGFFSYVIVMVDIIIIALLAIRKQCKNNDSYLNFQENEPKIAAFYKSSIKHVILNHL